MKSRHLMLAGLSASAMTLATTLTTSALAQQPNTGYAHPHMWGGHSDWGWGHSMFAGPLMVIVTIVVLAVVVMGVARLMGCTRGHCGHHRRGGSSAMAILEERFAKGEIDKAEFEERRNALKS